MFSRFFIDRPIFAMILSIAITLAGAISLVNLPIAMYPPIAPPTVAVTCQYPGASAQVVSETIAAPIEQQVNGVENMMYMSSQSTNDGSYSLTVTFRNTVDLNLAQVLVQNRVALAIPNLPDVIKATGVTTKKQAPDILLAIGIYSPDGRYDQLYLSNYATIQIQPVLSRLPGISDVRMFGQRDYSMRIWLDPDKLAARRMTAGDVVMALREQNLQVAAGQMGQSPTVLGQQTQITLSTLGRLSEIKDFEKVIIKTTPEGRFVRVRDVGRVELGAKNEDVSSRVDGHPISNLAIFQLPDANALETADVVKAKIEELKKEFPPGVDYMIRYDTTPFIRESINEVFKTLLDSVVLVALVVLIFLQNWRSAIIPLIAVPVGIVGTFAVMLVMGFSLNNLTLFGLVLAIGIVVDDAIVVVESVEHHIEHGMKPRAATMKAMSEVSSPVIAVGLVLSSVFIPCAFISGITGQFFRQFALTIASATVISTFNSLTLSPALAAMLLRPRRKGHYETLPWPAFLILGAWAGFKYLVPIVDAQVRASELTAGGSTIATMVDLARSMGVAPGTAAQCTGIFLGAIALLCLMKPINWVCGKGFELFNRGFQATATAYARFIGVLLRVFALVLLAYGGVLGLTYWGFLNTPRGFIPSQDMGYLLVNIQLPDSASLERTQEVIVKMEEIAHNIKGVDATVGVAGQSLLMNAYGSNFGTMFLTLKSFDERTTPETYYEAIANQLRRQIPRVVTDAEVAVFGPPPVRGVGRAGGYMIMIEDPGDLGPQKLQEYTEAIVKAANADLQLKGNTSVFRANVPQIFLDVDRTACMLKGVDLQDAFTTLQVYLGSLYINDFNLFGRTWQVIAQSEAKFRDQKDDINRLRVRNNTGAMVPLGAVARATEIDGPLVLTRYNMSPSASINGSAAPGVSSGRAIEILEQISKDVLPKAMSFEWTELAFLELEAGNTAMLVFAFSIMMVFLVLAAQFESWSMPLAVILSVPLCVSSALVGLNLGKIFQKLPAPVFDFLTRHDMVPAQMEINIFTQIGLVVLVGLASKNAILIVEFAKVIHRSGKPIREATLESCRLRLRPIIMTSMAFILGVLPLLNAHGAGAEMRKALGLAVFSGMIGVTLFGVLVTPVFFYLIDHVSESSLFGSPRVRRIGFIILGIVTLSYLWRPSRWRTQATPGTASPGGASDLESPGLQKGK